ncbi:uncharacterized protein [Euwallacea similis]|uniref:uncharacterized protein n=1 Tax=Euwallacea similis TaxID=1736056 RepID=UPI003450DE04
MIPGVGYLLILMSIPEVLCIKKLSLAKMNQTLQVKITNGVIQGTENRGVLGGTYFSYEGIPYAQPPISNLRFRPPKRPSNWTGVLDATQFSACCAGFELAQIAKLNFVTMGEEDCLYLNVYTPQIPSSPRRRNLPVIVFLHGGAFISGCPNEYGPDYLMQHDIILVTSNYRLGVFGFLSTEDLECPGNIASKDNLAVLKWVQRNIQYFGGDPHKVTLLGQSAGASLATILLLSSKAKGLFQGVILMSGSNLPFWTYQTEQRRIAFDLGVSLGIETNSSKELLEKLRSVDFKALGKAQTLVEILNVMRVLTHGLPFTPTIEPHHRGAILTDYAYNLLEKGRFIKVPILAGVTSLEIATFNVVTSRLRPFLVIFDASPGLYVRLTKSSAIKRIVGKKIAAQFFQRRRFSEAGLQEFNELLTDEAFWRPMRKTASLLSRHVPTYFYQFSYDGETGRKLIETFTGENVTWYRNQHGVGHGVDLSYLFPFALIKGHQPNKADRHLITRFCKIFTNFAKTGNPTPASDMLLDNITWPTTTQGRFPYMNLDESFRVSSDSFKEENFRFWEGLFKSYADKPYAVYFSIANDMKSVIVLCVSFLQCFSQCLCIGTVPLEKLNQSLQIQTLGGIVQGSEHTTFNEKKTFYSFVGIPYARPPIGYLRFKGPKPMPKWTNVLDATKLGPCCAGLNSSGVSKLELRATGQEDCLYLNVYTPVKNLTSSKETLAVMMYIYGGAFFSGCGNEYGPDFFMEENVLLVVPNFRTSIFGYLSTNDLECPGNWASKDHIAILKWIQLNIYKFGGDPKKVTIFGQSAGAANVNTLLLSQRAQDLFHRAILISGTSLTYWSYQLNPKKIAFDVGLGLGFETNNTRILMEYLRSLDGEDLQQVQVPTILTNLLTTLYLGLPLAAVKEPLHKEAILTEDPYAILEKGGFNKVPVMIGVTNKEGAYFRRIIQFCQPLMGVFNLSPGLLVRIGNSPRLRTKAALKILNHFTHSTNFENIQEGDLINFVSEDSYYRPSRKTADFLAQHSPVYFYQLSYEGEAGFKYQSRWSNLHETNKIKGISDGVVHTEDLAYLFTFKNISMHFNKKDLNMAKKMTKLYANFARVGNPTPIKDASLDNITWPKVIPPKFSYMEIGERLENVVESFDENNFRFWEQLYEEFATKPYKVF